MRTWVLVLNVAERRERLGVGVPGALRFDFFREEYALDYRLAKIAQEQVCF